LQSCLGLLQPIRYQETGFLGPGRKSWKNACAQFVLVFC
jgi:hypothetical protein